MFIIRNSNILCGRLYGSVVRRRYLNFINLQVVNYNSILSNRRSYVNHFLFENNSNVLFGKDVLYDAVKAKRLPVARFRFETPNALPRMDYINFFFDPKSILHNFSNAVVQAYRDNKYAMTIRNSKRSNLWYTNVRLNWPCNIEIEQNAHTEKEASYKAALFSLMLLKENNLITSNGKPIYDERNLYDACSVFSIRNHFTEDVYSKFIEANECEEDNSIQTIDLTQYNTHNSDRCNSTSFEQIEFPQANEVSKSHYFSVFSKINLGFISKSQWIRINIQLKDAELSASLFPKTLEVLNQIYNQLYYKLGAKLLSSALYNNQSYWICYFDLLWPLQLEISQIGRNKVEAKYNAANDVLAWLLKNDYIDRKGKPQFNLFNVNNNLQLNQQQIRNYCTQTTNQENSTSSENHTLDLEKSKKLFPLPKNILHNIYNVVSQDLNNSELKLEPQYKLLRQSKSVNWLCTYNLKWPEDITFTHTCSTKQEASNKAAIAALTWLKQNKKIDKHGKPILIDTNLKNEIQKTKFPLITLNEQTKKKMMELVDEYENNLKPRLIVKESNSGGNEYSRIVNHTPFGLKQKFRGTAHYKTIEAVKLPITDYRNEIMEKVNNNQVVIIKGEPGCGKSTRVPQYILENWAETDGPSGTPCRIAITQPRRIAALSLAERVAKERRENFQNREAYQKLSQKLLDLVKSTIFDVQIFKCGKRGNIVSGVGAVKMSTNILSITKIDVKVTRYTRNDTKITRLLNDDYWA